MVISASSVWTKPRTIMPATGASTALTRAKIAGNMRSSAAVRAVWAMVNCQPSSEAEHAGIGERERPGGGVELGVGDDPSMTVVERM